ncbi:Uncharacterized protein HZ326_14871 [Fusarium oxysporum f. sp. albedinis]|nr:Uncharacterized protein HZ326_14871 [Fusarium oxysporum f. sp. albedinis]
MVRVWDWATSTPAHFMRHRAHEDRPGTDGAILCQCHDPLGTAAKAKQTRLQVEAITVDLLIICRSPPPPSLLFLSLTVPSFANLESISLIFAFVLSFSSIPLTASLF